ncbi:MAG: hypothetical protein HY046_03715, partial [Acidobacteria bacterium]|nr:hypothetical protein [Acidobacteriota bacterium]
MARWCSQVTFRIRLLLLFVFVTVLTVGIVAWAVSRVTIEEFGRLTGARMQILNQQYEQELRRRGDEIVHRVQSIADTEATIRMALDMARTQPDFSLYQNDAKGLANLQQLKFLELVAPDGTILSSAHWPARFGQKNEWVTQVPDWKSQGAFLMKEQDADGFKLALLAVRTVEVGSKKLYIIGGQAFDREFLSVLVPPPGTRILLYKNLEAN